MLVIESKILTEISGVFRQSPVEQGFLLGCGTALNRIDHCFHLPAISAGLHFYEPDHRAADTAIRDWMQNDICFCGLIHSHVVDKSDLSENDIVFAEQLFLAYNLPVLWFALGILDGEFVQFRFYSVSRSGTDIRIRQEAFQTLP